MTCAQPTRLASVANTDTKANEVNDTNQLREAFEVRMTDGGKWPAAVEKGRGGAYLLAQTENAWTEWQACAESLQAIAQVQGEAATVAVDHFDNAPHTNLTSRIHPPVEIGTKLYTTPQPAQATQAEVTDEQINAAYLAWCKTSGTPESFARAILALRPAAVPISDEYVQAACGDIFASDHTEPGAYDLAIWRKAETAHGITAQADLWCIHIPGPDEVHAAPSKEAADHMAAKHNAVMATYYASGALNLEFAPTLENVQAAVIKWPYDKSSHYDELSAFDWAAWGITAQAKKETP